MSDIKLRVHRVQQMSEFPAQPEPGTLYFVTETGKIFLCRSDLSLEEYAGGGLTIGVEEAIITSQHIASGFLLLTNGADAPNKTVLILNTDVQRYGADFEVLPHGGAYRKISWAGRGLEELIREGDRILVIFPAKSTGGSGSGNTGSGTGGGHTIIDGGNEIMPQRSKLEFRGLVLTDDEANDTTIADAGSVGDMLRPYTPQPVSPDNESITNILYARLVASKYAHPLGVPMGGAEWQVSTDEGFAGELIYDKRDHELTDSIVLLDQPETTTPYLVPGVTYYWRVRYFDVRETNSHWSPPSSFSVAEEATASGILPPAFLYPRDNDSMRDSGFVAEMSQPITFGTVNADECDVQVAMTPNFNNTLDILKNYEHEPSPNFILDGLADFTQSPSPLYLRGRQRDSVREIESAWTPSITVWLRRSFSELCIGRRMVVDLVNNTHVCFWIDEDGNNVVPKAGYWDNHPIFGGMLSQKYSDPAGICTDHDVVYLPPFYAKGSTPLDTETKRIHDVWIKPTPFKTGGGIHPAFRASPGGVLVSAALLSAEGAGAKSALGVPGITKTAALWGPLYNALNSIAQSTVKPVDVHTLTALTLLYGIEKNKLRLTDEVLSGDGNNPETNVFYRGFASFARVASVALFFAPGVKQAGGSTSMTISLTLPGTMSYIALPTTVGTGFGSTNPVSEIHTGHNDELDVDLELYWLPKDTKSNSSPYGYTSAFGSSATEAQLETLTAYSGTHATLGLMLPWQNSSSMYSRFMVQLG